MEEWQALNLALKTRDIITELSVQNLLLFWKALCILKEIRDSQLQKRRVHRYIHPPTHTHP